MARPRSAHRWTVEVFRLDRQRESEFALIASTICSDYPIMGNLHDFRRGARAYDSCVLRDFEWKLCTFASTFLQRASRVVLSVIHTLQLVVRPSPLSVAQATSLVYAAGQGRCRGSPSRGGRARRASFKRAQPWQMLSKLGAHGSHACEARGHRRIPKTPVGTSGLVGRSTFRQ